MSANLSRDAALALLREHTKSPALIKHAMAVEAAMADYAEKFGEDVGKWRVVGILHDFDYEKYPDLKDHTNAGEPILREHGYPEDVIYAIRAHNDANGLARKSRMDKTLYAVDELCGFLVAVALVRPNKRIGEVALRSVKKKLKDKAFARQVNREDIDRGCAALGIDRDEHIENVLSAMQKIAAELEL
jgi:putative nucleotidyltransferase with HDIG domain